MVEMIAGVFLIGATLFIAVELIDRLWGKMKMATEKRLIDANALFPGKILAVNLKNPMETLEYLMSRINNAPTVDVVEVVHGRWIVKEHSAPYGGYHLFHCSECDEPNAKEKNYCPNCGAKMDGDEEWLD